MKILLVGESWVTSECHILGFDQIFSSRNLMNSAAPFIEALKSHDIDVDHLSAQEAHTNFPETVEELGKYSVVVLSDVGSNTFLLHPEMHYLGMIKPNRLKTIVEYVRLGGGLMMCGGYMSFSGIENKARYGMTPLAEILPVEMFPFDDRAEHPEGVYPEIIMPEHAVMDGIPLTDWPPFLGYNLVKTKVDAQLIASIEGNPFMVASEQGKGRTFAFTSDCMPHWASQKFMTWPFYSRIFVNIIRWLAESK